MTQNLLMALAARNQYLEIRDKFRQPVTDKGTILKAKPQSSQKDILSICCDPLILAQQLTHIELVSCSLMVCFFIFYLFEKSTGEALLVVPQLRVSQLVCAGRRAFSVMAPFLWNSLPLESHLTPSLTTFRLCVKTTILVGFLMVWSLLCFFALYGFCFKSFKLFHVFYGIFKMCKPPWGCLWVVKDRVEM